MLILTVAIRSVSLFTDDHEIFVTHSFFGNLYFDLVSNLGANHWFLFVLSVLLVFIQALIVNFILAKCNLYPKDSFVPAMVFIILTGIVPEFLFLNTVIIAYTFVLLSFRNLIEISGKIISVEKLFYTALFISIASLIYFPVSYFMLIVFMATFILKPVKVREILILFIGFLIPYYFLGTYFYLTDNFQVYMAYVFGAVPAGIESLTITIEYLVIFSLIFLIFLIGYVRHLTKSDVDILEVKRYHRVLQLFILFCILQLFLIKGNWVHYLFMLTLPITLYISYIFDTKRIRWFHNLILLMLLSPIGYFIFKNISIF